MDIRLEYNGKEISIEVMKDDDSFELAHKFCKKLQINPTIN